MASSSDTDSDTPSPPGLAPVLAPSQPVEQSKVKKYINPGGNFITGVDICSKVNNHIYYPWITECSYVPKHVSLLLHQTELHVHML